MTEAEWLAFANVETLVMAIGPHFWGRKRMLCGCGDARRSWHLLTREGNRRVIETSERYADGLASEEELRQAWQAIEWEPVVYCHWPFEWMTAPGPVSDDVKAAIYDLDSDALNNFPERRSEEERNRQQCSIIRDLFGNPFRPVHLNPAWKTGNVVTLAQAIYDDHAFERMPILADALEEAGCTEEAILSHCRGPGPHVRGCWVVDLLLGKE
jgi:hypothetical protein